MTIWFGISKKLSSFVWPYGFELRLPSVHMASGLTVERSPHSFSRRFDKARG